MKILKLGHICHTNPTTRIPNSSSAAAAAAAASQKPSHVDISGTKSGIIDPLVSKRPGKKFWKKKNKKYNY